MMQNCSATRPSERTSVLTLTRYGSLAASSRLRHFVFAAPLAQLGYSLTFAPFFDNEYVSSLYGGPRYPRWRVGYSFVRRLRALLSEARKAELLWIEKELFPRGVYPLDARWLPRDVPVVVDFDDDWMARYEEINPEVRIEGLRRIFGPLLDRAARVTCSNDVLAERLSTLTTTPLTVIPGAIDTLPYQAAVAQYNADTVKVPCVGWIGNPMTAARYLEPLAELLNQLQDLAICRVRLIGAGSAVRQLKAERMDWSIDSEASAVAGIDVGLMPLTGDAFSSGKSGFKLLQYMAAGRPFVTTPIPGIRSIVESCGGGFTATDIDSWRRAIVTLCTDAKLRTELGAAGHSYVVRRHSTPVVAQQIAKAFSGALRSTEIPPKA